MDETNVHLQTQASLGSDTMPDDTSKVEPTSGRVEKRLCLVGPTDQTVLHAAYAFGVSVVTSDSGTEYVNDGSSFATIFVLNSFTDRTFDALKKQQSNVRLMGPTALQQLATLNKPLPNNNIRPLYTTSMHDVTVCFTGFRKKEDLARLIPLIHHMGGSIHKDMNCKVTHLIANCCGGKKNQYASTFRVPIVDQSWVIDSWEERNNLVFDAKDENFVNRHKLKLFHGARICFVGFPEAEESHMSDVLKDCGGTLTTLDDPACTHVVVLESTVTEKPECPSRAILVKAEWFWASVQNEITAEEKEYLLDDYLECFLSPTSRHATAAATPSSASRRKRKRLHETLSSLAAHQQSPLIYKRRSSVSDAGLLSISGSFLDCTASPDKALLDGVEPAPTQPTPRKVPPRTGRHQVFLELVQTEMNYVGILNTIMFMFKKKLEDLPEEECLLNSQEIKSIFGNLPPIYDVHQNILNDLRNASSNWTEETSVGQVILKYSQDLLRAYPPFINFFEDMKATLTSCDTSKPRFHAFLKRCQMQPECGRQSLSELLIGPVQRLGRIILLLNDILKNTQKSNPDYEKLEKAQYSIREVMKNINEDKRKMEGQRQLFDIFNDIDNCPADLVSSHRIFKTKVEVIELSSSDGYLSGKGNPLVLHLFTDQLEVCKKRSKAFNTVKSPNTVVNHSKSGSSKPYKHIKLLPLNTIKRVIDIKETEECQRVFAFVVKNNDESKERLHSFALTEDNADKTEFLKIFCRQMADNACTADAEKFLVNLEPEQLDIDTSDVAIGTLSKAFKFASRTRLKVGRAFSFNKTPSKLKRAVSSILSPFGSSTNLTPASQLEQMKLASYSNISELGNAESPCANGGMLAPMSVQPIRKHKFSSLNDNQLKRV